MRRPEPWYWEKRQAWYIQVNKVQTRLGRDEAPKRDREGRPIPPTAVMREYHRLMASASLSSDSERERASVAEVCEAFLSVKSRLSQSAYAGYVIFLRALAEPHRDRRIRSIRVADVEQVAESHPTWNESTRHAFAAKIVTLFRWAKDAGYLEFNPLAGWEIPWAEARRERELTETEYRAILEVARDLEFKQILGFLRGTGCRPGEARKITAAHVHPEKPLVILAPGEHKTGRKTNRIRTLYMPEDVERMVRALAIRYPTGPLFRNARNGGPWRNDTIAARFRVYRRKLGLGEEVVPYLIRHATLTRLLDGGASLHHTMAIAGHSTPTMLMKTYYHADPELLVDAVNRAHAPRTKGDAPGTRAPGA